MNKFEQFKNTIVLKEDDGGVAGSSDNIAPVDSVIGDKKLLKRKTPEETEETEETEEIKENIDFNDDGKVDYNDIVYMVKDLSYNAVCEIIDLVSSYLIKKYEEPGDNMPADGQFRQHAFENVIRKIQGDKIILKSSLPGFKVSSDGREVRMNNADLKKRVIAAIAASKRRRARQKKDEVPEIDEIV